MQGYDPAIRFGCMLAPSVLTHPPLVTSTQLYFEQALHTQRSDEDSKQSARTYHFSNTNSAQNAGPIAISTPYSPGFGWVRFMVLSRIISTEADEIFPTS